MSARLGDYLGQFYTVVSEKNNVMGVYYVIGMTTAIYVGLAFEQALTKSISNAIAVHVRRRVTTGIYEHYFRSNAYYKISSDDRLKNPDQQLTQDIDRYSVAYGVVMGEIVASPVFIAYFWYEITVSVNYWVPLVILAYYLITFVIQRFIMSPISAYTYKQEKLEGAFRHHHQKIDSFAESIALSRGEGTESTIGMAIFKSVLENKMKVVYWEFLLWFLSYLFSFGASIVGSIVVALPLVLGKVESLDSGTVATTLYDIGMLAWGFTKVTTISTSMAEFFGYSHRIGEFMEIAIEAQKNASPPGSTQPTTARHLTCSTLTLYDPNETLLLKDISFTIKTDTLIMGPSGCGKTSLIRAIGGLWPIYDGELFIPKGILFFPQNIHLPFGNIIQQIIYPSLDQSNITHDTVLDLLKEVGLDVLLDRDDLFTRIDWDFLSPGQRQCLAATRVLYHSPEIAVLDEVTSHVDEQSEIKLYSAFKRRGIILLSIGHRPTLKKFHQRLMVVDITRKIVVDADSVCEENSVLEN
uniref:ABC transporter domain-containing protein n=1 Tax=Arcella intermedia TaxID=1963864 RepID=A0A6B2L0Q5_9EUKA